MIDFISHYHMPWFFFPLNSLAPLFEHEGRRINYNGRNRDPRKLCWLVFLIWKGFWCDDKCFGSELKNVFFFMECTYLVWENPNRIRVDSYLQKNKSVIVLPHFVKERSGCTIIFWSIMMDTWSHLTIIKIATWLF